jgi:DNA-binding response OmpR family regulator
MLEDKFPRNYEDPTEVVFAESVAPQERADENRRPDKEPVYRVKMGRVPIWLTPVEFRILSFLASRPYHAYTRSRIAQAASSDRHPVSEESVDGHIATLRQRLGFFRDYIQTVPYIGYRFKE